MKKLTPYQAGRQAFKDNKDGNACPYETGTVTYFEWMAGMHDAWQKSLNN